MTYNIKESLHEDSSLTNSLYRSSSPSTQNQKPATSSNDDLSNCLSIATFCELHNISRKTLYRLWERGDGPAYMKIGTRVLISCEAAAAWRARRTVTTEQERDR